SAISIFLNQSTPGAALFAGATNYPTAASPRGIAAGLFTNSQGKPAPGIAVPNSGSNTVSVLVADNTGSFSAVAGSPFTVGNTGTPVPNAVAAADLNGDGLLDLAVVNSGGTVSNSESTVTTLMNDGAGSFGSIRTITSKPSSAPDAI